MPSIYDLKPRFQSLLRPLNRSLVRAGVTANGVTLFAMGLSILLGLAIAYDPAGAPKGVRSLPVPVIQMPGVADGHGEFADRF